MKSKQLVQSKPQKPETSNESVIRLYQHLYLMLQHKREVERDINETINAISYLEK
jgi:hypothetical protein